MGDGFRPILYCRYIATPEYLADELRQRRRDVEVVAVTGALPQEERMARVEALTMLVRGLPVDLPAALFVVLHIPPYSQSHLPTILSHHGPLPAAHAIHGEAIAPGRIYVAPPDHHLLVRHGHVELTRGPRENPSRPAVDPLFHTAARAYGPRVVARPAGRSGPWPRRA